MSLSKQTAGVVIDDWKLPIFKEHLGRAGYEFTEHAGPKKGMFTLRVQYEWVSDLKPIIEAANTECSNVSE